MPREPRESREPSKTKPKALLLREEIKELRKAAGSRKTVSGKEVCFWFNSSQGCRSTVCRFELGCCAVKEGGKGSCVEEHTKSQNTGKSNFLHFRFNLILFQLNIMNRK